MAKRTWFSPRQKKFLELVSHEKYFRDKFYLTGGTALAAVYYNHRYSDDLDFFSPEEFSIDEIGKILLTTKKSLGWIGIKRDIQKSAGIYILAWEDYSQLKLDFNLYAFERVAKGPTACGISIDSLKDIAINKLDTILTRKEVRDYIDLYTIFNHENWGIKEVYDWHQKKIQYQVDLIGLVKALLSVREAQNYPRMKIKLSRKNLVAFFENEARKLEDQIFT